MTENPQTALSNPRPQSVTIGHPEWEIMQQQADTLLRSGFLPDAIKTPAQVIAIVMTGRELGIPMMQALRQISVIKGKPTLSSELMLALIYRDHGDQAVQIEESTPTVCQVAYRRKGWSEYRHHSFTMQDASKAGITGKDTWRSYPAAMLRARCIAAVARMAFPDSIEGMYTPEEVENIPDNVPLPTPMPTTTTTPIPPDERERVAVPRRNRTTDQWAGTVQRVQAEAEAEVEVDAATGEIAEEEGEWSVLADAMRDAVPSVSAPSTAAANQGKAVNSEAWKKFDAYTRGHLKRIGCAKPFIDQLMDLIIEDMTQHGELDNVAMLQEMYHTVRAWDTSDKAIKYAAVLNRNLDTAASAAAAASRKSGTDPEGLFP